MASATEFYQTHLNQVSRSFALCIERLDSPLREWIGLAYLICRIVDTVEDTAWPSRAQQLDHFKLVERAIAPAKLGSPGVLGPLNDAEWAAWLAGFPAGLPASEIALLQDSRRLFADLQALPPAAREPVQSSALRMARGMARSLRPAGGIRLSSLLDLNRYCYFVAGTVGELLTGLLQAAVPDFVAPANLDRHGCQFGLFLQKVNVLKDQTRDQSEGRFLVPDRTELFHSVVDDARGALAYLLALPTDRARSYRVFCAWSLYLGLVSLPFIQQSNALNDELIKIPRGLTRQLLVGVEAMIDDDAALTEAFEEQVEALTGAKRSLPVADEAALRTIARETWLSDLDFRALVSPRLSISDLCQIGLA